MPSNDPARPNILFILADDHGAWALGSAGNPEVETPNLDRLSREGMRFENFFCASPVCSAARASIMTGRIPSQHGIHDWLRGGNADVKPDYTLKGIEYLEGMRGYTDFLAEAGWNCGISGKWHMGHSRKPQKGLQYWEVMGFGGCPYYGTEMIRDGEVYMEDRYITDVITDHAVEYLEETKTRDEPFYLSVHHFAPHSPWDRQYHPSETWDRYQKDYALDSVPRVPLHPNQIDSAPHPSTDQEHREILGGYYTAVTEMDRNIGRLLDWLDENGLRENTLVIFTGDNGMNIGHHGVYGKGNGTFPMNMYDTSVKVPMIMSQPGTLAEDVVVSEMLSHYDVMPTLLDRFGLENPEADSLPGASFNAILDGQDFEEREPVVIFDEYGPVRMIRTKEWKYVHRYAYGPHELYNLADDPGEERNLIDDEAHDPTRMELKARLDEWFVRYVDPALDGVREPVTGKGQVNLAGPAGKGEMAFVGDWRHVAR